MRRSLRTKHAEGFYADDSDLAVLDFTDSSSEGSYSDSEEEYDTSDTPPDTPLDRLLRLKIVTMT